MYQYKVCGLPNVFLQNGYKTLETKHGKSVAIENVKELHKAIGLAIINKDEPLSGEEVRFLRKEMLMSQESLAATLGLSESSIRKLETGKSIHAKIDPTDRLIRIIFAQYLDEKSTLRSAIDSLNKLNNGKLINKQFCFFERNSNWVREPACI